MDGWMNGFRSMGGIEGRDYNVDGRGVCVVC